MITDRFAAACVCRHGARCFLYAYAAWWWQRRAACSPRATRPQPPMQGQGTAVYQSKVFQVKGIRVKGITRQRYYTSWHSVQHE